MVKGEFMKTSELRLGNIVIIYYNGKPMKVLGIKPDDISGEPEEDIWYAPEGIKPYPITEALLLKLGFVRRNAEFISYNLNGFQVTNLTGTWFEFVHRVKLSGLHDMQNLYFYTRGSELNIPDLSC